MQNEKDEKPKTPPPPDADLTFYPMTVVLDMEKRALTRQDGTIIARFREPLPKRRR